MFRLPLLVLVWWWSLCCLTESCHGWVRVSTTDPTGPLQLRRRECSDRVVAASSCVLGLSLAFAIAPTPVLALSDRFGVPGTELLRLDGSNTPVTETTFMIPSQQQRRAMEALQKQRQFQDERLAMREDRGVFWEDCFIYGVGGPEKPGSNYRRQQTSNGPTTVTTPYRSKPPTW